jgi:uncharacterized protein
MAPEILVRGEGEARVLPDRAVIRITVDGEGATQDAAYGQAAQPAKAIDGVLDRYGDALAARSATAMAVLPRTKWKKGESLRTGFRATRVTSVEVTDLARLGSLIADLAAAGPAAINGPVWQVDPDNDVHHIARQKAIADGRRRASSYAEALGLQVEGVAWVAEPGLRHGSEEYASLSRGAFGGGQARGVAEEPIDVSPDEVKVRAVVEMSFSTKETEPPS